MEAVNQKADTTISNKAKSMLKPKLKQFALGLLITTSIMSAGTGVYAADLVDSCGKAKASTDTVVSNTTINIIDNSKGDVPVGIASKLGCDTSAEETYHLIFGKELASYGIVLKCDKKDTELRDYENNVGTIGTVKLTNTEVIDISNSVLSSDSKQVASNENINKTSTSLMDVVGSSLTEAEKQTNKKNQKSKARAVITTNVDQTEALLSIDCADENYKGAIVQLTPEDRDILERLVMGEAGGEGYEGAALVAQAIRDTMVYRGFGSVAEVRSALKYSGSLKREPNQSVLNAVSYVFDEGGVVVKHPIFYFYAPGMVKSSFHESQKFIIEHGGHRFFSPWSY